MALAPGPKEFICSARDCKNSAVWKITWRNPALHYGRSKVWLACADHLDFLVGYFDARNFPYEIEETTAQDLAGDLAAENSKDQNLANGN